MKQSNLALAAIGGLVLYNMLSGKKAGAKTIEPETTPAPSPTPSPFEEDLNKYWATTPSPTPYTGYTLMEAIAGTQKGNKTWIPNDSVPSFLEGGEWQVAGTTSNAIDKALVDTTAGAKTIEPETTPAPSPTPSPFEEALNKYWPGMPIEPETTISKDLDWYAKIIAAKPGMATVWTLEELQQALTNPSYTQFFVPYKPDSKTMTAMAVAIISARGNNAPSLLVQQWPGFVTTFGLANALEASQVWGVTVEQLLIGYGWW